MPNTPIPIFIHNYLPLSFIGSLSFAFVQSMKADEDEVKKVKIQAQEYIKNTFKDETVIYGTVHSLIIWVTFQHLNTLLKQ